MLLGGACTRSLIISSGQFRAETEVKLHEQFAGNDIIAAGACTDIGYLHTGGGKVIAPIRSIATSSLERRSAMNKLSARCG